MRKLSLSVVLVLVLALSAVTLNPAAQVQASPADVYSPAAPYFGAGNLPPGCENDVLVGEQMDTGVVATGNACYQMRTDMNGLDSPQVDVLVMVPASPTAERDMRIMRQSIEMWEGGIDYLASEMDLGWLADGMDFHITVDYFDPAGDGGGEFTTYPIVDPEIVVIAANPLPFANAGIGIDPVDAVFVNEDIVPCQPVANPFDIDQWEALPGFNSHHEARTGTYVEDCGGSAGSGGGGGNTCFAVNAGGDPPAIDVLSLFDLVSHEVGHCLTIGHVGDGLEGSWGKLASNDIMAYSDDPPGLNKCVSTLDVEGIALRMSKYLDVNADGSVTAADQLYANDPLGQGGNPFQVQNPRDHLYASSTGDVMGCPQPDTGLLPGPRTDWTPTPVRTSQPTVTITSPANGTVSNEGIFNVTGTVEHVPVTDPIGPTASVDDADDDANTALTEILDLNVAVTDSHVNSTIRLADLPPATEGASPTTYSIEIDDRKFDSFVYGTGSGQPRTWDAKGSATGTGAYMPAGTSTWDLNANTVTFKIPRSLLDGGGIVSPYYVGSTASIGVLTNGVVDDAAPNSGDTIGVAGAALVDVRLPQLPTGSRASTTTFEQEGGNVFYTEDSTLGVERGTSDLFTFNVAETSDVTFDLTWTDAVGGADIDVYVTGAADSGNTGATASPSETVVLEDVAGLLNIRVSPYFITDPLSGSTYTLTATVTSTGTDIDTDLDGILDATDQCPNAAGIAPTGCPDSDGDGVIDLDDVCPNEVGNGADGCPIRATERVQLWVGGAIAASQDVDTANGADTFSLPVALAEGTYELRVDWETERGVVASQFITLTHNTDDDGDGVVNSADRCPGFDDFDDLDRDGVPDGCDTDSDGDRVADHRDNCKDVPNANQANIDGDARGDVCDSDKDGDGHSNDKEVAHGTDPADPNSYPGKPKTTAVRL